MTWFDEDRLVTARMCADLVQQLRAGQQPGAEDGCAPGEGFSNHDFPSRRHPGKPGEGVK